MKLLTKKIGVLGFGIEGQSVAHFLESRRIRDLIVYDENKPEFPNFSEVGNRDVLIRSPGVSPHHPALQNFRGKIIGSAELFFQLCPTKKVIGVTGTKGKGTTSTLISKIFEEANDTVFLVGNIGVPFFEVLPNIRTRDVVIAELSSFQLWDSEQSPQIAVLLRTNPDHLEKHLSFDEYLSAKRNIFLHQKSGGRLVYCADCPVVSQIAEELPEETLIPVSLQKELPHGAFRRGDEIIWKTEEGEEVICEVGDIKLRGEHNLENVVAAIAASKLLNVRTAPIQTAIQKFSGLPYRLQLIAATRSGIHFWNDSCATTPSATIAGIKTFSQEPLILISGGSEKNADYNDLGKVIVEEKPKALILMGKTGVQIGDLAKKSGYDAKKIHSGENLEGVFAVLEKIIDSGDNILFSPASASFDQFKNEYDRGEKWNAMVNEFLRKRK
ncbi:UDP-N-acetylmuramoyl-L-alanine--D-glutamate ligase [Candidatus Peregrinibacteria bacterium]|nr:MAG: UDP-N-acetylmuramoyl-L-alanine--D-glutamate ligase [Candidatus Peregrinibacteria bacterium]